MIISELDDGGGCELLNVSMQDARKLAQALLQAADEIDRWATTRGTRKSQRSARHPCGGGPTTFAQDVADQLCAEIKASPNRRQLQ